MFLISGVREQNGASHLPNDVLMFVLIGFAIAAFFLFTIA